MAKSGGRTIPKTSDRFYIYSEDYTRQVSHGLGSVAGDANSPGVESHTIHIQPKDRATVGVNGDICVLNGDYEAFRFVWKQTHSEAKAKADAFVAAIGNSALSVADLTKAKADFSTAHDNALKQLKTLEESVDHGQIQRVWVDHGEGRHQENWVKYTLKYLDAGGVQRSVDIATLNQASFFSNRLDSANRSVASLSRSGKLLMDEAAQYIPKEKGAAR